jgi:hypothetical protein
MILRRLTESLKEQNWTAIVIEFVLLVAGVFLGIQVANWNESRHEDERAQQALARLQGDLQADLRSIGLRSAFWPKVNDYGRGALRYAETGELVQGSAWKTVLAFYQASQLWPWVPADSTYQELRSAGELGLIRDPRLRADISKYYAEASGDNVGYILAFQPEYRRIVRGLTPAVVSNHVWSRCWTQTSQDAQELLDCPSPISEAEAQALLDGYLKDPRLLGELRFWLANQGVALNVIGNTRKLDEAILARIQAMQRRSPPQ